MTRRERLPDKRRNETFDRRMINGHPFTVQVGFYLDGRVGEVFINVGKRGGTLNSFAATWSMLLSVALQYGAPLHELIESHEDFEHSEESGIIKETMEILRGFPNSPPESGAPVPTSPTPLDPTASALLKLPRQPEALIIKAQETPPEFQTCPACQYTDRFNYTMHEVTCLKCNTVLWRDGKFLEVTSI